MDFSLPFLLEEGLLSECFLVLSHSTPRIAIGTAMLVSTNTLIFLPHATALSKAGPEIRL